MRTITLFLLIIRYDDAVSTKHIDLDNLNHPGM